MPFEVYLLKTMPNKPGVYLMKDRKKTILYIGKAKNLKKRLADYFVPKRDGREMIPYLTSQIETIETIITFNEKEALLLENTLIKQHQPKYNIQLKDDKTFISLMINHHHKWPMIRLVRNKHQSKDRHLYFGPYTSAYAARQTLDLMQRLFPLRQCSDRELLSRKRPCLLFDIGRCLAPCVGKCTPDLYARKVEQAVAFLKGKDQAVTKSLKKEMETASKNLEFEKAHVLLKLIKQIEHVTYKEEESSRSKIEACDVLALCYEDPYYLIAKLMYRSHQLVGQEHFFFTHLPSTHEETLETFLLQHYSQSNLPHVILLPLPLEKKTLIEEILSEEKQKKIHLTLPKKGEKLLLLKLAQKNGEILLKQKKAKQKMTEELLLDLEEACELTHLPLTIECFDVSNISKSDFVACMVAFKEGEKEKKKGRFFKIKHPRHFNDIDALKEVLRRHYAKAKESHTLPDLTLIDGGKGQLNAALEVFEELKIASVDLIALCKEKGRHDKGLAFEKIFIPHKKNPIFFSPRSSTLFFLQKIRDEAHRVALGFHRKQREKRTIQSALDHIPGIGPIKKKRLLKKFGSVKNIQRAKEELLLEVEGMTKKDLLNLKTHLIDI